MAGNRKWLIESRDKLGLTQQKIANEAKIDRSFYAQIENGTRNPSVETAKKIAAVLNFKWTIFFDGKSCERQQKNN